MNKTLVFAGVVTLGTKDSLRQFLDEIYMRQYSQNRLELLFAKCRIGNIYVQAIGQMFFTGYSLAQYYCIVDFLRDIPLVIFIRILYLHNPETCGARINVGEVLDDVPNQAFVFLRNEPFTTTRTFYINCIYLGLCSVWILFSVTMIMGGARGMLSKHVRWPWVIVTSLVTVLDMVSIVTYANDSFHTQSLPDMLDFIGGSASGLGNAEINTTLVSWTMVFIYSRVGVLLALNLCLIIVITVECGLIRNKMKDDEVPIVPVLRTVDESIQVQVASVSNDTHDIEESSVHSLPPVLPRVGLSQSFRRMKQLLFKRPSTRSSRYDVNLSSVTPDRQTDFPPQQPPPELDKKRTVNFPVNLLSLPQRLENLIAEQQKRLDNSVVDTSGRTRTSQSLPHLETATQVEPTRTDLLSRRGTAAELQGQLPWAYIPASAHPMRDQLPPDEDLPPVPLPDYTAIPTFRKASVHRAASSISSLTRKDYKSGTSGTRHNRDVLY